MPLSKIQSEILFLSATHRNPEGYVAGAVPLSRDRPRYSADIDIFHDGEESVAPAADARICAALGMKVEDVYPQNRRLWVRLREKGIAHAKIRRGAAAGIKTKVGNHSFRRPASRPT